jgi:hypothetical protein
MTYRRRAPDHRAEAGWRRWLTAYRDDLAGLGLPLDLYSSLVAWQDFLANGCAIVGRKATQREFDFNDLTVEEQRRLHVFLERVHGADEPPPGLLGFLRVRAAHGWVPPFFDP